MILRHKGVCIFTDYLTFLLDNSNIYSELCIINNVCSAGDCYNVSCSDLSPRLLLKFIITTNSTAEVLINTRVHPPIVLHMSPAHSVCTNTHSNIDLAAATSYSSHLLITTSQLLHGQSFRRSARVVCVLLEGVFLLQIRTFYGLLNCLNLNFLEAVVWSQWCNTDRLSVWESWASTGCSVPGCLLLCNHKYICR